MMANAPSSRDLENPVELAKSLIPLIRECADEAERERQLPARLARTLAEAGLHRIAAPRSVGGAECTPETQIEVIEIVSGADGATGWNLMIGIEVVGFLGAVLEPEFASKLFADPRLIVSGALNLMGRAIPVEGGYRVTGQWPFASGCHNSDYFWGQCIVKSDEKSGGPPTLKEALIPRADFEVLDTWHVSGMRGSGSNDVAVHDLFVPDERMTAAMGGGPIRETGTLFRLPPFSRLAYNKVGVATGIARAALDQFAALAAKKHPRASAVPLQGRAAVQLAVAEAEVRLRSARAFVLEAVAEVWDVTEAGHQASSKQRALVQLACSNAVAASVRTVEIVCEVAGTSANWNGPLERCLRDVRVVPQHIMVSSQWNEAAGRVLLGMESGTFIF